MNHEDDKCFKILSIDGGGIKGLYSATILSHFEEKFGVLTSDYFDLLCGTSTGGLIALAASLKKPMSEVCKFYVEEGPKIFHEYRKWPILSKIFKRTITEGDFRQILDQGKFSDTQLKQSLVEFFDEHKIGESNNFLCIPSYTITEAQPWVFKFDHGDLDRDNKALYVDVALATSAAPTFFPMAEISYYDNKQFIDGGIWANNPTMVGLIEALRFFVGRGKGYNKLKILSISSLSITGGKPTGLKRERSFWSWNKDLFDSSLYAQSFFTHYFMEKIKELNEISIEYFRIPTAPISREQEGHIQLDVATPTAINLIRGKGNDVGEIYKKKPEVAAFYQQKKLSKTK